MFTLNLNADDANVQTLQQFHFVDRRLVDSLSSQGSMYINIYIAHLTSLDKSCHMHVMHDINHINYQIVVFYRKFEKFGYISMLKSGEKKKRE